MFNKNISLQQLSAEIFTVAVTLKADNVFSSLFGILGCFWRFGFSIYFIVEEKRCSAALLWSSINVLWTTKLSIRWEWVDNDFIFINDQLMKKKILIYAFWLCRQTLIYGVLYTVLSNILDRKWLSCFYLKHTIRDILNITRTEVRVTVSDEWQQLLFQNVAVCIAGYHAIKQIAQE